MKKAEKEKNGAYAVLKTMEKENVEIIFGYPGGATLPVYDQLPESSIRHVLCRHEQAGVHMADGYARASGKPGVCMATSGPGATNMVTGLATAFMDSSPVVAVTGQVPRDMIGNDAFQEVDITGITIPVTKHNYLVPETRQLPGTIREAFYLASTGRKGPVLIDIPRDVLTDPFVKASEQAASALEGYNPTIKGHSGQIKKAAAMIRESERPVIICGGGIIGAEAEARLEVLAINNNIPVAVTLMGKNGFPNSHRLYLGLFGYHGTKAANNAVQKADLIIAVGTRFGDRSTGPCAGFAPGAGIIHIDIDPAEISKNIPSFLPIVGDASNILETLAQLLTEKKTLPSADRARKEWTEMLCGLYDDRITANSGTLSVPLVIDRLCEIAPDSIITTDVGRHQIFAAHHVITDRRRSFITSGGLGTMGFGLPAAIGAKAAKPGENVFSISGDGSFLMCCQELVTAVEEDLPVTVLLMKDGKLGMISQLQDAFYGGRHISCDLGSSVNFAGLAESMGAYGQRVSRPGEIVPAIEKAAASGRPSLIEFIIDDPINTYPMVTGSSLLDYIENEGGLYK